MDNENGKVKFKVGVFTPKGQGMVLQIYKRTKCYIWIQFKGHPNCPDVYKRKINENNERSECLIFLGGWVSADRLKPSVFDGIDNSKGCFTTQGTCISNFITYVDADSLYWAAMGMTTHDDCFDTFVDWVK